VATQFVVDWQGKPFVSTAYLTDRVKKGRLIWPVAS